MGLLKRSDLKRYTKQGFLILKDFLPDTVLNGVIADIESGIERGVQESLNAGKISVTFADAPFDKRLALIEKEFGLGSGVGRHVFGKQLKTAGMFSLMTHPLLLDLAESCVGSEILVHPQFNCQAKRPRETFSRHQWHQDLVFLDQKAANTPMLNLWIPLVGITNSNGCLEVIPGSHLEGLKPHLGRIPGDKKIHVADRHLPKRCVVTCLIERGDLIMFHPKLIHRSQPNRSQKLRWTVDIRYSNSDLPSGRDDVPGFIARSTKSPTSVAKSNLDWQCQFED
jgi:phytanoyl-CoA hydroxylase